MNGFIKKSMAVLCLTGGLAASQGCYTYRQIVDPCYPDRYNYLARHSVLETFGAQVNNGHILHQTIWNYQFERGTDRLNPAGQEHLLHLIRHRPAPDPIIYLATAQDLVYSAKDPDDFANKRRDLDARRIVAIQKYLGAQTADRGMSFQVMIHDPAEVGIPASQGERSIRIHNSAAQGVAPGATTSGGGAAPTTATPPPTAGPGAATGGGAGASGTGGTGTGSGTSGTGSGTTGNGTSTSPGT